MKNVLRVISIISFAVAFILATVCGVDVIATINSGYGTYVYKGSTGSALFGANSIKFTDTSGKVYDYFISAKPFAFQLFGLCLALVALVIAYILEEKDEPKSRFAHFFLSLLIFFGGFAMFFTKVAAQSQVEAIKASIDMSNFKCSVSAPGFVISGIFLIITAVTKFWSSLVDEY